MGKYDECVRTCNFYLGHIKGVYNQLEEVPVQFQETKQDKSKKITKDTQFVKVHCHPLKSIKNKSLMHPLYNFEQDKQFVKDLYRLKGFAYLRSDVSQKDDKTETLLKSLKAFEQCISDKDQ